MLAGHEIKSEVRLCIDHPTGHEIKSEVGLCIDHSGGSRDQKRGWVVHRPFWRVTRSKARLSHTVANPEGHEVEREAVVSAIDSVNHFNLPSSRTMLIKHSFLLSSIEERNSILLFSLSYLEFEKTRRYTCSSAGTHIIQVYSWASWLLSYFAYYSADRPTPQPRF